MATGMDRVREIAGAIDHVLVDELKLQPPMKYQVLKDGNFILMLAVMDVRNLRGSIHKYANDNVVHQLSTAVGGLPVVLNNHSGLRYAVSLTGRPKLQKTVAFPDLTSFGYVHRDEFLLGMSLRGVVNLHATKLVNMLISGSQDSGKSMVLRLMAHEARMQGSTLFLADPMMHTFNPDLWNAFAQQPVAGTRQEVIRVLEMMQAEVEKRTALFRGVSVQGVPPEDLAAYNLLADHPLPRIFFIGDEMNTYLSDRTVQERVADLARVGRKWGVHLVIAAHNWRSEDISRGLSAMFPTRLCLHVADDTSGNVTLGSPKWGKQALKLKHPGRAILLANGKYQKVQLYYIAPDQEREWMRVQDAPAPPLPEDEMTIVMNALKQADGKMTMDFLVGQGLSDTGARKLAERYEARGWLEKDPNQGNARVVTDALRALVDLNHQTPQRSTSPYMQSQTSTKPNQTPDLAGA